MISLRASKPNALRTIKEKQKTTIILDGMLDEKMGKRRAAKTDCSGESTAAISANSPAKKKNGTSVLDLFAFCRILYAVTVIRDNSKGTIPIKPAHSAYFPLQSFLVTGLP